MRKVKRLIALGVLIIVLYTAIQVGDYIFYENDDSIMLRNDTETWQFAEQEVYNAKIDGNYFSFNTLDSMEIDYDYIIPETLDVHAGESVKLMIYAHSPCTFRLEGYDIVKKLEAETLYELEFKSFMPGRYEYSCNQPFNRYENKGTLVVS